MVDNPNIQLMLSMMTKRQRDRWRMRLNGMSLQEIADLEGVSYQAVWDSMMRGVNQKNKRIFSEVKNFLGTLP